MTIKSILIKALLTLLLYLVPQVNAQPIVESSSAITAKKSPVNKKDVQYLFVMEAKRAEVLKSNDGAFQLIIKDINPTVLYFSDRPIRKAGHLTTVKFINELWAKPNGTFYKNPPNVAITHSKSFFSESGFAEAVPLELSNPKMINKEIIFTLQRLDGVIPVVRKFSDVRIFIDASGGAGNDADSADNGLCGGADLSGGTGDSC